MLPGIAGVLLCCLVPTNAFQTQSGEKLLLH
jgi:hypothetical protein